MLKLPCSRFLERSVLTLGVRAAAGRVLGIPRGCPGRNSIAKGRAEGIPNNLHLG